MPTNASVGFVVASFVGVLLSVYASIKTKATTLDEKKEPLPRSDTNEDLMPVWWPDDPLENSSN